MEWNKTSDQLPPENTYVLCYLGGKDNWRSNDDPYYKVLMIEARGSQTFNDNNLRPYSWDEFGPSSFFGQEVTHWCLIKRINK